MTNKFGYNFFSNDDINILKYIEYILEISKEYEYLIQEEKDKKKENNNDNKYNKEKYTKNIQDKKELLKKQYEKLLKEKKQVEEKDNNTIQTKNNITMSCPKGYKDLGDIFVDAMIQASVGKGKERHANSDYFIEQPIIKIAQKHGLGFLTGQAEKKLTESLRILEIKGKDAAIQELLGSINYIAAACIFLNNNNNNNNNNNV